MNQDRPRQRRLAVLRWRGALAGDLAIFAYRRPVWLRRRLMRVVNWIMPPMPTTLPLRLIPPDYAAQWLWEDSRGFRRTVRELHVPPPDKSEGTAP